MCELADKISAVSASSAWREDATVEAHRDDDAATLACTIARLEDRQVRRRAYRDELDEIIRWHDDRLALLRAHAAGVYPALHAV